MRFPTMWHVDKSRLFKRLAKALIRLRYAQADLSLCWLHTLLDISFGTSGPDPGYKTFFMLNSTEHEISTAH